MHTYCNHSCIALKCFIHYVQEVPLSFPQRGPRVEQKIMDFEGQGSNVLTGDLK